MGSLVYVYLVDALAFPRRNGRVAGVGPSLVFDDGLLGEAACHHFAVALQERAWWSHPKPVGSHALGRSEDSDDALSAVDVPPPLSSGAV